MNQEIMQELEAAAKAVEAAAAEVAQYESAFVAAGAVVDDLLRKVDAARQDAEEKRSQLVRAKHKLHHTRAHHAEILDTHFPDGEQAEAVKGDQTAPVQAQAPAASDTVPASTVSAATDAPIASPATGSDVVAPTSISPASPATIAAPDASASPAAPVTSS